MWFRLISFLFLAGCFWVGVEVYTNGTQGAFGGALSGIGPGSSHASENVSTLDRVRGSASGARDRQLNRIESQLEDPSVGLQKRGTYHPED